MNLSKCPLCRGEVHFHQDAEMCPSGCHFLHCNSCQAEFDLSMTVDPKNECLSLDELRSRIAIVWNSSNARNDNPAPVPQPRMSFLSTLLGSFGSKHS